MSEIHKTDGFEKVLSLLSADDWDQMIEYLKSHESDIAHEINDFSLLRGLFLLVFGEAPEL